MYLFTPCMECCGQAEIVYAFQSIEKKVKKGSIKESHGAVDKSSSEQQFRKWEGITFAVLNFWSHTPSGTRSYGRQAGRQAGWLADKIQVIFEFFKIHCRSK